MKKISVNIENKNEEELIWIHETLNKIMSYKPTTSNIINMAIHGLYMDLQKEFNNSDI